MEPTPEEKRNTFEYELETTYIRLVRSRTALKVELKLHRQPNRFIKEEFYEAFIHLYGLAYQRIHNEQNAELIKEINKWDETIKLRRHDPGIEEGIRLSERLQEVLKETSVLG